MKHAAGATVAVLLTLCMAGPATFAQTPAAPITAPVAPGEVREVVAEGRAAIGAGGVLAARRAATAQALRNAVEKAVGVYVSARSLTQNYQLVRDQVTTHAEGFSTLQDTLRETVSPDEVSVTVRALVSLRPLAEQLKGLGLTRAWRVRVVTDNNEAAPPATIEQALTNAGFVVASEGEADILVQITPRFTPVADTPLDTAAGPMVMHSVRAQVSLRATRLPTGEVVASLSEAATAPHISVATAQTESAEKAARALAPRLADLLLVLPARDAQHVELVIAHLSSATQTAQVEDALQTLAGVRGVTRRGYEAGRAVWELDVYTDTLSNLPRTLETDPALRPFHLAVTGETRARIAASAAPNAPVRRRVVAKKRL